MEPKVNQSIPLEWTQRLPRYGLGRWQNFFLRLFQEHVTTNIGLFKQVARASKETTPTWLTSM